MNNQSSVLSPRALEVGQNLDKIRKVLIGKTKLIAVSKTFPLSDIYLAYQSGQRDFGENRIQELQEKSFEWEKTYPDCEIRWHFIGHLQSNKMKLLLKIPQLFAIHSLDSMKLVKLMAKEVLSLKIEAPNFFLQINTSGEEQKGGFHHFEDVSETLEWINKESLSLKNKFLGLMTLSKLSKDHYEDEASLCFKKLAELKVQLEKKFKYQNLKLSMGMSDDFLVALSVGTDYVRIGSKIFGTRT